MSKEKQKELANFLDWAKEYTNNKLDYGSSYLARQYLKSKAENLPISSVSVSIDTQVGLLTDTLDELMTGFDTKENRMDFILDICNTYKKKAEEYSR